ncbi:D-alanyl-D-alanine carboxypeptidase [Limibaculum sp. FT325]|uniref:D-alanyl-D-alanine carboxypeptidase family protein n=1 Tax=Thermohalobaculum sediminis TaxID=2939436 RepID=UPI0020C0A7BC|nr:D-alanyl-D-alanine carboxypeptidase family protein [Limibaculum sediminis]MCL5778992.1 D-alanyl-D-alanine carboxypeptidase [Limibaculum sediminis]
MKQAMTAARIFMAVAAMLVGLASAARAETQTTPARAAVLIDMTSGAVLLDKNADEPLPPASMSKLMTLYMVFEAIEAGRLSPDDSFRTSAHAASFGGSKMFIREGEVVRIEDLLRGVIVQSGNDAAVALAEALAGSETAFAALMNKRAPELGLTASHFANATGWPDPEHYMSAHDLALLGIRIIEDFPQFYPMFAETEFTWDGIAQKNRNPLLAAGIGADGLKTGHTEEAGYGLVASAKRGERRLMLVVTGLESMAQRQRETERLMNWAFRAFDTRTLFAAGTPVAEAEVWIGQRKRVPLAPARDVVVTAPLGAIEGARLTVHYDGPVPAPIEAGTPVGRIEIAIPDMPVQAVPLVAAESVAPGGFLSRIEAAAALLMRRALGAAQG